MRFKEDILLKIITFITVTILLGAIALEAYVIYKERSEKADLEAQLSTSEKNVYTLIGLNQTLEQEKKELQEFKNNWENLVILADNKYYEELRTDLASRPELIPEAAVLESVLVEEADRISKEREENSEIQADFSFPDAEIKDWLMPLNLGNKPSMAYLFYARAEDPDRGKVIDLLFEVPVSYQNQTPSKDEDGNIIWNCMAYDAGLGWQIVVEEETEE